MIEPVYRKACSELLWLADNTIPGLNQIFPPALMETIRSLADESYHPELVDDKHSLPETGAVLTMLMQKHLNMSREERLDGVRTVRLLLDEAGIEKAIAFYNYLLDTAKQKTVQEKIAKRRAAYEALKTEEDAE